MSGARGDPERHCGRLQKLLCLYLDGELNSEQRAMLEQHLQDCPFCLELLESLRQTKALCRELEKEAVQHAMPEELKATLRQILIKALTRNG